MRKDYVQRIGQPCYNIEVVEELRRLAEEDEFAARVLHDEGSYRNAIYLTLQALEKTLRAEIFSIVDPSNPFFRDYNYHHSLKMSFDFLAQIASPDIQRRAELRERLDAIVPPTIQHESLNNSLRYPWYSKQYSSFNVMEFDEQDSDMVLRSLEDLQKLFKEIEKYRWLQVSTKNVAEF